MAEPEDRALDVAALERALRDADPTAWLVPPRILRRVIKRDKELTFLGLQVPHRRVYTLSAGVLGKVVDGEELGLHPGQTWPPVVILLARPNPEELAAESRPTVLTDYWRMLFHARVHVAVEGRFADGSLTDPLLRDRIDRIGRVEFDEVRSVLRQEHMLLPPGDDRTAYVEFAATYLELRYFAPTLLAHVFPGIEARGAVEAVLADDVDGGALFAATRLTGAPDPEPLAARAETSGSEPEEEVPTGASEPAKGMSGWLIRRAEAVASRGNVVRAAILRAQAARHAPRTLAESVRSGARAELDHLVRRLQRRWDSTTRRRNSGGGPCRSCSIARRGGSGRPRRGCSTTSRRSASTTSARSSPSTRRLARLGWSAAVQARSSRTCAR